MNVEAARAYAERHGLEALVVQSADRIVHEQYAGGYDGAKPHALYSGTKGFWGIAAVAARDEGLLDLDEPVGTTFETWSAGEKSRVRLRDLLQLTSGIGFGGLGSAVPTFEKALATPLRDEPGTRFTYGGIPLQVFGAVLNRKLRALGLTPHAYLQQRIFDPIGVRVGSWRTLSDGTHPLPTGAFLTPRAWLSFGLLVRDGGSRNGRVIVRASSLAECFTGSAANPRYGLCWWLSPIPSVPDLVYASGAGGQALYVIPSAGAVIVRFGRSASYKHDVFLKRLLLT